MNTQDLDRLNVIRNFGNNETALLEELPQYYFDRYTFCHTILQLYPTFIEDVYDYTGRSTQDFSIIRREDEFYIIHWKSGTIINWYKHLGRTNTCNKPLTITDLRHFIVMFKNDMAIMKGEE